ALLIIFAQRSASPRTNCVNAALLPPTGSTPSFASCALTPAVASALLNSAARRSTIGAGVPAGTAMPTHTDPSSGGPAPAKVGTSGRIAERFGALTASALSRFVDVYGCADAVVVNIVCTCPPSMSLNAGAAPLYGTCVRSAPETDLNSSSVRCVYVPLP